MAKDAPNSTTEAAVDWLTATAKSRAAGGSFTAIYNRYKVGSSKETRFFGFDCLRDEAGLTVGKRATDQRYIFIAPGKVAGETWQKIVPVASKITRIDLACDVWLDEPRDQIKHSARIVMSPFLDSACGYTLISGISGKSRDRAGDTLYVGSRKSMQFGRLYDKGLKEKTAPVGKWLRYEVEYKDKAAFQVTKESKGLKPGPLGEFIRCTVYDWFCGRSVIPVFLPKTDTPGLTVRSHMVLTSPERKLAWLKSQVQPTVKHLFELGLEEKVFSSLGIEIAQITDQGYNLLSPVKSTGDTKQLKD